MNTKKVLDLLKLSQKFQNQPDLLDQYILKLDKLISAATLALPATGKNILKAKVEFVRSLCDTNFPDEMVKALRTQIRAKSANAPFPESDEEAARAIRDSMIAAANSLDENSFPYPNTYKDQSILRLLETKPEVVLL